MLMRITQLVMRIGWLLIAMAVHAEVVLPNETRIVRPIHDDIQPVPHCNGSHSEISTLDRDIDRDKSVLVENENPVEAAKADHNLADHNSTPDTLMTTPDKVTTPPKSKFNLPTPTALPRSNLRWQSLLPGMMK